MPGLLQTFLNKYTILTVSGLTSPERLESRIRDIVQEPSGRLSQEAFEKTAFLPHLSQDLGRWLRKTLANSVLDSRRSSDLRRIEVSVAWIPPNAKADVVWKRCMTLYSPVNAVTVAARPIARAIGILRKAGRLMPHASTGRADDDGLELERRPLFKFAMMMGGIPALMGALFVFADFHSKREIHWILLSSILLVGFFLAKWSISYIFRAAPEPLTPTHIPRLFFEWHRRNKGVYRRMARSIAVAFTLVVGALIAIGILAYAGHIWLRNSLAPLLGMYGMAVTLAIATIVNGRLRAAKSRRRFDSLLLTVREPLTLIKVARDISEARCWIVYGDKKLFPLGEDRRAFTNWLVSTPETGDWRNQVRPENLRRLAWEQVEVLLTIAHK